MDGSALSLDGSALANAAAREQGEVYLLSWATSALAAVDQLPSDQLLAKQADLTQTVLSLLAPTAAIKPGRPLRSLLARLSIALLHKTDEKGLYDLLQALLKGAVGQGDGKGAPEREKEARVASVMMIGEVFGTFGSKVMSLFVEVVLVTTKICRTSSYPVILRTHALLALRSALNVGARSLSDALLKDTLKALRSLLGEQAGSLVRLAAECLLVLSATSPSPFATLPAIENILQPAIKALEQADGVTRRALARFIAGVLAQTQDDGGAAASGAAEKKSTTLVGMDDDPVEGQEAPKAAKEPEKQARLKPAEMLAMLSTPYNRSGAARSLKNALLDVYAALFEALGTTWVEVHYPVVLRHLVDSLGCGPAAGSGYTGWNARLAERADAQKARFEALAARKAVGLLLREVLGGRSLSEPGQFMAVREVTTAYLKRWPTLLPSAREKEPSKQALLIALDEVAGLLRSLGSVPQPVEDELYEPLLRLIAHPSYSVQVAAAWSLRAFVVAAPMRLGETLGRVLELLNKDLAALPSASPEARKRPVGYANALAGLITVVPAHPLYVSFDLSTKCMSVAIQLLKQSGEHELAVSAVEISVAWTLVAALMGLGTNFVRLHLPQLLILWRNALPKPTAKEQSASEVRGEGEWAFLLLVREQTLGAVLAFLTHNAALVGDDVARRLVTLLSNVLAFSASFQQAQRATLADQTPAAGGTIRLLDRDLALRRRLLQALVKLGTHTATLPLQTALVSEAVSLLTDPERYLGVRPTQAAIVAASGGFRSTWEEVDGLAYGVTSLLAADGALGVPEEGWKDTARTNRDLAERRIGDLLQLAAIPAPEYDPLLPSLRPLSDGEGAVSPATGVVDASIELFATYFPIQSANNQLVLLQQVTSNLASAALEKNPGRKMAILANAVAALLGYLRAPVRGTIDPQVAAAIRDVLMAALKHRDARLRSAAAEGLARLSSASGTGFMASLIQGCVNEVVSSTDPSSRAGCALAFGETYSRVGGLAAGPVLKTIVDVLLSLSTDPHPLVHYYSLQSLSQIINSASLSYGPFTNRTLGLVAKLYMRDTHEPEGGSPGSVNLRGDLPACQAFCRVLDALIGILGPEFAGTSKDEGPSKAQELLLILVKEFLAESDEGIVVEAIKATQHLLMFVPDALDRAQLVTILRAQLGSSRQPLRLAAVNSIYQLVQRDAITMSKVGGDALVQDLFRLLDDDPSIEGVRDVIASWLKQTADANPSGWIDLCQRIMSRSAASKQAASEAAAPANLFTDEESQGLGLEADAGQPQGKTGMRAISRWRTQLFALQCVHYVFEACLAGSRPEHFDLPRGRQVNRRTLLISRVPDLIKMAFTASTAQLMEIRMQGLVVLRDVIENFSHARDLDFEDALLLEQHQAPIAAALTPAFAADSFPDVVGSAIQVCAVFVGSGVVKEMGKMGRILKLLTMALASCKDTNMVALGDVKDLSSTASVMLKTSIFAAWAELQVACVSKPYLKEVVKPHLAVLCPFWVATLREYARMCTDPDAAASDAGVGGAAFDSVYSGLSRETALPLYEKAWIPILHAVAALLQAKEPNILAAMDGSPENTEKDLVARPSRDQPALFFWVLFGLAYEALCNTASGGVSPATSQVQASALAAVDGLVQVDVAGTSFPTTGVFDEVVNLCYRLVVAERPEVKRLTMQIIKTLVKNYGTSLMGTPSTNPKDSLLSRDSKLTQCLRVATCALQECVPTSMSGGKVAFGSAVSVAAHTELVSSAFVTYVEMADSLPAALREQLYSIALFYLSQLMKVENSGHFDIVGPALGTLKSIIDRAIAFTVKEKSTVLPSVLQGFLSSCLQNVDSLKGREGLSATAKVKNNLLASVIVLTSLPPSFKLSQDVVEHACLAISQVALTGDSNVDEPSATALHCLLTLLAAGARRESGFLKFCIGQLLPAVIEYIARAAETADEKTPPKKLEEVIKVFVAVVTGVHDSYKPQALSLFLQSLCLLLTPANPTSSHNIATTQLLALASSHPAAFKEATSILNDEQKSTLEKSIKDRVLGMKATSARTEREEAPRIELKMFG